MSKPSTITGEDGRCRCGWCGTDPLYQAYHDTEWGVPEWDDRALFEKLILDGFQAGLSWITILMQDTGIVRNRAKIEGAVANARGWLKIMEEEGSFADYLWNYVDGRPKQNSWASLKQVPAETRESQAISKDLRKRGFTFVGPTIVYAFMQAVGMVNDHTIDCFRHKQVMKLKRPAR
jgi:DNA-3-methyladenine glycosylase I